MKIVKILIFCFAVSSCVVMHHTQVGDVDATIVLQGEPFEIMLSETGVNLQELGEIAKLTTRSQVAQRDIGNIQSVIALFQMGPRTGNPVYNDIYGDALFEMLDQ